MCIIITTTTIIDLTEMSSVDSRLGTCEVCWKEVQLNLNNIVKYELLLFVVDSVAQTVFA